MSIKTRILELLVKEELTSAEISVKLGIKSNDTWVHLNALNSQNKVKRINDKKPYVYKAITPLAYLKRLYEFMSNENKCDLKNLDESDISLLEAIKEVLK